MVEKKKLIKCTSIVMSIVFSAFFFLPKIKNMQSQYLISVLWFFVVYEL